MQPVSLPVGTLLRGETYRIIRFISSGGFGCTYEAEHVMLRKRVAVKEFFVKDFCNRDGTTSHVTIGTTSKRGLVDKLCRKFIEEARAISQMQHPNIVGVSDVFGENGTAYYVMDYIEGSSLSDVVNREGQLTEQRALRYIRQVADALRCVHSLNRLHLDVKPGNIMVDKDDNAILIDFGASKHYDEESGENTSTLMGVNTKGYAPIEQVNASFTSFSPATDIYALGATLYKLLTGITPPSSLSLMSEEEELRPLPASISKPVRDAVGAAMQLKRKARPKSMEEFVSLLPSSAPIVAGIVKGGEVVGDEETKLDIGVANTINGHEYVDLGLSVKWATCNVGASSPSDYGDYFAWGETSTKSEYNRGNSVTYGKKSMVSIAGNPQYDAAQANWGNTWRLPTKREIEELVNKCKHTWTTQGEHKGYKITGPNGNSIFLPAAGWRYGTSLYNAGGRGYYWSATPYGGNARSAYSLYFNSGSLFKSLYYRDYGQSVRPVSE